MKKYYIQTWGCQMNFHDSEKAAGVLEGEGLIPAEDEQDADVIVLNTCSIREKAEQKFLSDLGRLKRLRRQNPSLRIAVMGCVAQQMGNELKKRAENVDYVLGPQNIHALKDVARGGGEAILVEDNPDIADNDLPVIRKENGKAWVTIMYGCNNFCSYCIVPYTRGRERSRPAGNIIKEIKALADEGFKEVTLLGQNVNSYAGDVDFPGLLRMIDAETGIERVRFVTSNPKDLSDGLVDAMAELKSVCESIHLPLQSGSDRVLKMMNRKYTISDYIDRVEALRAKIPDISITSDIIAGFPGESEEDHKATMKALKEIRFNGIFAFKYSPRPGTRAEKMDGELPESVKSHRLSEILALQDDITLENNRVLEGTIHEIYVEGPGETQSGCPGCDTAAKKPVYTGRTRTNKVVNFYGSELDRGRIVSIRITRAMRHSLFGDKIN